MDTYVRDNTSWLATDKPHARVYNTAGGGITDSTDTALTFTTARVNVQTMWSVGAPTRLTVPTGMGGFYLIGGHNQWAANATGTRALAVKLNNSKFIARSLVGGQNVLQEQSITTAYQLAAGDYVELIVYQSSGGALNVNASDASSPEFWAIWQST